MKKKGFILIVLSIVLSISLIGCTTTLSAINKNPQEFAGKNVSIRGTIKNVVNIPFTEFQVFLFADEDSQAAVFSTLGHEKGEKISLSGSIVAFPENAANEAAAKAAEAVSKFIIDKDLAEPDTVKKIAGTILGAIGTISKGLGSAFFIIEG